MIKHMFVFGVLIPTVITIIVFVGFLICWFKFNIKERVMKSHFFIKHFTKQVPNINATAMHDSVVFSREYPGQGHPWDDHNPRSDNSKAVLIGQPGMAPTDSKGRLLGLDWTAEDNVSLSSGDDSHPKHRLSMPTPQQCPCVQRGQHAEVNCRNGPTDPRRSCRVKSDGVIHRQVDDGCLGGDLVPQTFHFPTIGGHNIKYTDAERHMRGIPLTGTCPEDTDYGHFIPITRDECERSQPLTPTSCSAASKDNQFQMRLVSGDCTTGPAPGQQAGTVKKPPVEDLVSMAQHHIGDSSTKFTLHSDGSPSLIPAI